MNERNPDGQITTETRGHIYLMGLDRPEKLNGMTPKMWAELSAAYDELDQNSRLRAGVLLKGLHPSRNDEKHGTWAGSSEQTLTCATAPPSPPEGSSDSPVRGPQRRSEPWSRS